MTTIPQLRILSLREVMKRTGKSRATVERGYREGTFPKPVRLGPRSRGWLEHEIEGWIAALPRVGVMIQGRGGKAGKAPKKNQALTPEGTAT